MNKGFSLIELMIVIAILGILGAAAIPHFTDGGKMHRQESSQGFRCVSGYKFVKGIQMIDNQGKGIVCNTSSNNTVQPMGSSAK